MQKRTCTRKKPDGDSLDHTIPCLGLIDEALDMQRRLIGYVGFHEYDGYIPILRLRSMLLRPADELRTVIYCLKTGYGYHFISFEIMNAESRKRWAEVMLKIFPGDYLQMDKEAKHRVLRLSDKGENPPPRFLFATGVKPMRPISLGHVQEYLDKSLIPEEALALCDGCKFVPTKVNFCVYLAKNKRRNQK